MPSRARCQTLPRDAQSLEGEMVRQLPLRQGSGLHRLLRRRRQVLRRLMRLLLHRQLFTPLLP
jgi:hypothetical protein